MQQTAQPIVKDLVLIGGGHSHAIALRLFGQQPLPGVRLTLLSETSETPYSGMLPGHVAGFYTREECHMDLWPLTQFAGAQFYIDRAIGLDLNHNRVLCAHRPPVRFDVLSIDIGSTPKLPAGVSESAHLIPAKPVRQFLQCWQQLVDRVTQQPQQPLCLGIVGGGAGGVELALNLQHRLHQILRAAHQPDSNLTLHLFHRHSQLLSGHNAWIQAHLQQLLTQRGVQLHLGETVTQVPSGRVQCQSGLTIACDAVVWVTQATAPAWLRDSGLQVDAEGFIRVADTLQSLSHPQVFAAGDIATMVPHPCPKAGVFAVRQGPHLFRNLCRALQEQPLRPFHPQQQYLSLIGTGDGSAVASRGPWGWQSRLLWVWKDHIDRAFMAQFRHLSAIAPATQRQETLDLQPEPIQSGGEWKGLLHAPDGVAILSMGDDLRLVQTVNYGPVLLNDPFVWGQIATHQVLNRLYAMGASPHSALAIASLPQAWPALAQETLDQLLAGARSVLQAAGAELIAHEATVGPQLAFGLIGNGVVRVDQLLTQGDMGPDQVLILTKALGSGTLLAAQRYCQAKGWWVDGAIAAMTQSHQAAAACLMQYGATACTVIGELGLAGHLLAMVKASNVGVQLELNAIAILDGALVTLQAGFVSALQAQNQQFANQIEGAAHWQGLPRFMLLFDPQIAGGLLASLPTEQASPCLADLKARGYTQSAVIGATQPMVQVESSPALIISG
jgi:selenide,water dikinase